MFYGSGVELNATCVADDSGIYQVDYYLDPNGRIDSRWNLLPSVPCMEIPEIMDHLYPYLMIRIFTAKITGADRGWGWRRHWVQQNCLPTDYICPPWFWGNTDFGPGRLLEIVGLLVWSNCLEDR